MQGKGTPAKHATDRRHHHPKLRRLTPPRTVAPPLLAIVVLGLMLGGCGGTSSSTKSSANQSNSSDPAATVTTPVSKAAASTKATGTQAAVKRRHVPIDEKVDITSPAFAPDGLLPARYTCDGADTPPPLRWSGIPAGTAELQLYVLKIEPEHGHLIFNWAVAGINPKLHGLLGGKLPAGAVTGLNSNGKARYEVCPPNKVSEGYVIVLLALPHSQHPKQDFDAVEQRLKALHEAEYEGFLVFKYPHS
jgi:phosphatidylethanolamine-binding protein (PEBP) family uncharacterized protein